MKKIIVLLILTRLCITCGAQQDNSAWHGSVTTIGNPEQRNWNDIHLISIPTTKTVDTHHMEFNLIHRFGNMGDASGGGVHTLYGFDVASDIYFSFDVGLLKDLQVGIGRSKQRELIDMDIKYRPFTQKRRIPVSASIYEDIGIIPQSSSTFYGADNTTQRNFADRFVYLTQLIVSRRVNRHISLELVPTLNFRNHVLTSMNTNKDVFDENDIPSLGVGGRYMFNGFIGVVADYYYIISPYRVDNNVQSYYNAFSVGIEMHTGAHVFQIDFSNASGIIPANIIPYTTDSWAKGGFKLGFAISRLF